MSDKVTCKAVLVVANSANASDYIYLECAPDFKLRVIPCRPKGQEKRTEGPEWEYTVEGDRLHVTPSLLCMDTQFHTAYNWDVAFEQCPQETSGYEHFYTLNPEHR